jgi:hypothetical protein
LSYDDFLTMGTAELLAQKGNLHAHQVAAMATLDIHGFHAG